MTQVHDEAPTPRTDERLAGIKRLLSKPPHLLAMVGLLTAISYVVAYLFELGYVDYYGIPFELINLSPTTVFYRAIGIFIIIVPASFVLWYLSRQTAWTVRRAVVVSVAIQILMIGLLISLKCIKRLELSASPTIMVLLNGVSLFLAPAQGLVLYNSQTHKEKELRKKKPTHILLLLRQFMNIGLVGVIILQLLTYPFIAGHCTASSQQCYLRPADNDSIIILRIYGDVAVCAEYDKETRTVYPRFQTFRLTDRPPRSLVFVESGRLKPAQP